MKIKKNFVLRNVAGQNIVVPVNSASFEYRAVITLNETGAFLWNALATGVSEKQIVEMLLKEYDVPQKKAESDVAAFIKKLDEANLLDK